MIGLVSIRYKAFIFHFTLVVSGSNDSNQLTEIVFSPIKMFTWSSMASIPSNVYTIGTSSVNGFGKQISLAFAHRFVLNEIINFCSVCELWMLGAVTVTTNARADESSLAPSPSLDTFWMAPELRSACHCSFGTLICHFCGASAVNLTSDSVFMLNSRRIFAPVGWILSVPASVTCCSASRFGNLSSLLPTLNCSLNGVTVAVSRSTTTIEWLLVSQT